MIIYTKMRAKWMLGITKHENKYALDFISIKFSCFNKYSNSFTFNEDISIKI